VKVARVVMVLATVIAAACERETRMFRDSAEASRQAEEPASSALHPGGAPAPTAADRSPYQENAWGIAEGKRLFDAYNCSGCHSHGGGGMGPALMDDKWIYGSHAAQIYETIVQGRPNGMPAFRNKITDQQVWQLVAYVQSMSGHAPIDALPGRTDHMWSGTAENQRRAQTPIPAGHQ
jgi:cytochrome c oxidase cbb3-type subunit III